jgi:hypothetical protein
MKTAPSWFEYIEAKLTKARANAICEADTVRIDVTKFLVHQPIEVQHSRMTDAQRVMFKIFAV